jgi:serine/threonine protein kinase
LIRKFLWPILDLPRMFRKADLRRAVERYVQIDMELTRWIYYSYSSIFSLTQPAFVAPEVLETNCRYDERCDMWSVGCLLYILIGGYPPFQARNHRLLFRKIKGADFCFHDQYFKHVSVAAKQLIAGLLTVDPKHRVTADYAIKKSRWLKMRAADLEQADLSASLNEMKKFQARASLKGAMRTVLWSVQCKFKSVDDVG